MKVTADNQSFNLSQDVNLLDALHQNGVDVPYQCKDGYCGTCRMKIVKGEVTYTEPPLALLNQGEILPCCATVNGDIELAL